MLNKSREISSFWKLKKKQFWHGMYKMSFWTWQRLIIFPNGLTCQCHKSPTFLLLEGELKGVGFHVAFWWKRNHQIKLCFFKWGVLLSWHESELFPVTCSTIHTQVATNYNSNKQKIFLKNSNIPQDSW